MKNVLSIAAACLVLAGCSNQILSEDRIRDTTAMSLGQPSSAVVISNRQYDGMTNTYYTARVSGTSYRCLINGGGLLAGGMTAPPQFAPLGSPIPAMTFGR